MILLLSFLLERTQMHFGTLLELKIYSEDTLKAYKVSGSIFKLVAFLDELWRKYWEGYTFEGETLKVDSFTDRLLLLSLQWLDLTDSSFNPFYRANIYPERLDEGLWFFPKNCKFDPGGLAKGLVLDYIALILEDHGIDSALVNFGGSSILAFGRWEIDIYGVGIILEDGFLSVSYSRRRGEENLHIYDPKSGSFVESSFAIAVIGRRGVDTDALSTYYMVAKRYKFFKDYKVLKIFNPYNH